jgi:hypothetical protein
MKSARKEKPGLGEQAPKRGKQSQRTKQSLSKAISIYNHGGVPIVSEFESNDDIDRRSIEGGFLVAITQFSNMKLPTGIQPSTITFESKERGTFIVARTDHFIGSLLWRKDLGVPMSQSKTALIDLLKHLETSCNCEDPDDVQSQVEQFMMRDV